MTLILELCEFNCVQDAYKVGIFTCVRMAVCEDKFITALWVKWLCLIKPVSGSSSEFLDVRKSIL